MKVQSYKFVFIIQTFNVITEYDNHNKINLGFEKSSIILLFCSHWNFSCLIIGIYIMPPLPVAASWSKIVSRCNTNKHNKLCLLLWQLYDRKWKCYSNEGTVHINSPSTDQCGGHLLKASHFLHKLELQCMQFEVQDIREKPWDNPTDNFTIYGFLFWN